VAETTVGAGQSLFGNIFGQRGGGSGGSGSGGSGNGG
jgi:hypothetical protein